MSEISYVNNKENEENSVSEEGFFDNAVKQVFDTGSITVRKNGKNIHCITIIGQIEGHYLASNETKTTKSRRVGSSRLSASRGDGASLRGAAGIRSPGHRGGADLLPDAHGDPGAGCGGGKAGSAVRWV